MGLHQINSRETPSIIDESDSEKTYLGFPKHGMGLQVDLPVWGIQQVKTKDSVTKILYPNGSKMKEFIWDDRGDYDYLPFGEVATT